MRFQEGMGLIEIMVALLLLAIAVMGFSAMQMTAVKATDESLMRTRALTVMRGGAEMMRGNANGIAAFKEALNGSSTSVSNTYTDNTSINKDSCKYGGTPEHCTIGQLATRDALSLKQYATDNELKIQMDRCPGTFSTTTSKDDSGKDVVSYVGIQERQCFISSWGKTDPIFLDTAVSGDDTKDKPCAKADGTYHSNIQCFIMEAY